MKTKKLFTRFLSLALALVSVFMISACAKTPSSDSSGGGNSGSANLDPDDHYVTSLEITKAPNVTEYMAGERFNPEGMEVTVKWEDGVVWKSGVDFSLADLSFRPNVLSEGDVKVSCYFDESNYKDIAVTVGKAVYSMKIVRMPAKLIYIEGETFDKNGLIVSYGIGSSQTEITDYDYSPKGELKATDKEIIISYKDAKISVPITVNKKNKAVHIEAEDCELYGYPGAALTIRKKTETGGGLDLCEKASGGDFVVDATPGDKMTFRFTAEAAGKAKLSMTASSNATEAGAGTQSSPSKANDMQVNKVLKLFVNDEEVAIADSVVLKGVEFSYGTRETWVYWRTVILSEINVKVGENKVVILMIDGGGYFNSYDKEAYGQYDAFDVMFL